MFLNHPSILYDLVKIAQREQSARLVRSMMIAEANRGHIRGSGFVSSARRAFGAGVIGIGNWIHGGHAEVMDLNEAVGTGSVRIAR